MKPNKKKPQPQAAKPFRAIASGELTLSATEIVALFETETGHALHSTNAGKAAQELGLDYVEVEPDNSMPQWKKQKQYAVIDLPLIFGKLNDLVARRSRSANRSGGSDE